ncbi:transposase [Streptomyces sp. NPDC048489]|uniref:transposase n=1 Tax=Streptomyces sp. NPDC048489 TaxID=3154504 RepID=UPI0034324513
MDRLESSIPRGGERGDLWSDHRRVINGVLYRVRTGVQRRDLPERFGRGRPSTGAIAPGPRTVPGRYCCRRCRPSRRPRAGPTETSRWTPRRCVLISMPPV